MQFIKRLALNIFAIFADKLHAYTFGYMSRSGMLLSAAHTAVASFTDATYAISASLPATYDGAGYAATTITYTAIGKVSDFIAYGSTRSVNEWIPIAGAVEYTKGAPRYGTGDIMMGDIPADAGQVILKAAEASANHYSLKITYPDTEVHYLDIIVSAWQLDPAKEGAAMVRKATVSVCKAPVVVAAS